MPRPLTANQAAASGPQISAAAGSVGAFSFASGSKDSALIVTLAPGEYTAMVKPAGDGAGTALVEVYALPIP
jgi:hypothetical protein